MRFINTQTSFRSGRLSPRIYSRIDTGQYRQGCSEMNNFKVMPDGSAERVKGTRIRERDGALNLSGDSRMWSIVVANKTFVVTLHKHVLDRSIRISRDEYPYTGSTFNYQLLFPSGTVDYDLNLFDCCIIDNVMVFTHFSGDIMPFYYIFNADGTFNGIKVMGQGGVWGSVNANVKQWNIDNPGSPVNYVGEGIQGMPMSDWVNNPITIGSHATESGQRVFNVTSTDPAVAAILQRSPQLYIEGMGKRDFGDGNDRNVIGSANCFVKEVITNGVKVYAPFTYSNTGYDIFQHLGITVSDRWAYSLWWEGNWPRTCVHYEGRLVFGGTPNNPLTITASMVGSRRMFNQNRLAYPGTDLLGLPYYSGDVVATDPYVFKVAVKNDSFIAWMQAAQALVIGTDLKEYVASGGDTIISALSINIKPITSTGSVPCRTANSGSSVYFLSSNGRKMHRFRYNSANGTFVCQELSLLFADKLETDKIRFMEWCTHLKAVLICTEKGALWMLADDEALDITAFSDTLVTGVTSIAGVTVPYEKIVTTFTRQLGSHLAYRGTTDIFVSAGALGIYAQETHEMGEERSQIQTGIVEQNEFLYYHNATYLQYAGEGSEELEGNFYWNGNKGEFFLSEEGVFPISISLYSVGPIYISRIIEGFSIPEEVTVFEITQETLDELDTAGGYLLLPMIGIQEGDVYVIGRKALPCLLATMPVEAGAQYGTAQLGIKNIDTVGVRHYRTYAYELSSDNENWQEEIVADEDGVLTTGRHELRFTDKPEYDQRVFIRNTKNEPVVITSITTRGVSNDG